MRTLSLALSLAASLAACGEPYATHAQDSVYAQSGFASFAAFTGIDYSDSVDILESPNSDRVCRAHVEGCLAGNGYMIMLAADLAPGEKCRVIVHELLHHYKYVTTGDVDANHLDPLFNTPELYAGCAL